MTHEHAAKCLLKLGRLSFFEFWAITGWKKEDAKATLDQLESRGEVEIVRVNNVEQFWSLREAA